MKNEQFTIVIPFYDGLDTIRELVDRIEAVFEKQDYTCQIIIVDDSAPRAKHEMLQQWFGTKEKVTIMKLPSNEGQHRATLHGLRATTNGSVVTLDEDLQHCPEDIPKLIRVKTEGDFDVVYGSRKSKDWRFWIGKVILKSCFPNGPKTTCSFRVISQPTIEELVSQDVLFSQIEGMLYNLRPSYGYAEIQLNPTGRVKENSTYSTKKAFILISNLIAFYSWFPIVWVSILCLFLQVWLSLTLGVLAIVFVPFSSVSVLILTAYLAVRTSTIKS